MRFRNDACRTTRGISAFILVEICVGINGKGEKHRRRNKFHIVVVLSVPVSLNRVWPSVSRKIVFLPSSILSPLEISEITNITSHHLTIVITYMTNTIIQARILSANT